MRLFLAVEPDDRVREHLAQRIAEVRRASADASRAFRWTMPANIHVTLHFLGDVEAARVAALRAALAAPLRTPAFVASTGALGLFPERGAPRVLWLGIGDGARDLREIHAELGERLQELGFDIDPRPFTPHFTIARVRDREQRAARGVSRRLRDLVPASASWTVDRVTLFESNMSVAPPRYVAHAAVTLGAPA
jgi:2'-5' RNA ligase